MPIAIGMIHKGTDPTEAKRKVNIQLRLLQILFYALLITWFTLSAYYGDFVVRESCSVIFLYITVVFCLSLLSLRKQILSQKVQITHDVNFRLLYLNLVAFALSFLFSGTEFAIVVY